MGFGIGLDVVKHKNCPEQKYRASAENIPIKKPVFDVVTALEIIEHVNKPEKVLKEIKRILKRNGKAIVSTPNNSFLWRIIWPVWQSLFGGMWKHTHKAEFNTGQWLALYAKHFKIGHIKTLWGINLIVELKK